MIVDKSFLYAKKRSVAVLAFCRVDVDDPDLADVGMVEIEHRREAKRDVGRLERGVALE